MSEFFNRGDVKKVVNLAPSRPAPRPCREPCETEHCPCHHESSEEQCLDTMRIFNCPTNDRVLFYDYHIRGSDSPQVAYGPNDLLVDKKSRWYCQVYPQDLPHLRTLRHSPNVATVGSSYFDGGNADLIYMLDLERNDILIQLGTSKKDCCDQLVKYHVCQGKILSMGSCCQAPLLFVGIDTGQVLVFYFRYIGKFKQRGELVLLDTISSPCSCSCADGFVLPLQISICCIAGKEKYTSEQRMTVSILYQRFSEGSSVSNFISSYEYAFSVDSAKNVIVSAKVPLPRISNSAFMLDFRLCCNNGFIFVLVRNDHGCLFLLKYNFVTGEFIGKAKLPAGFSVKSWTILQVESGMSRDCCAIFILSKCMKNPCTPSYYVVTYCCNGAGCNLDFPQKGMNIGAAP